MSERTRPGGDIFNRLSDSDRARLRGILLEYQIRDLNIEIDRAKRAHIRHLAEIREHLKTVEREYGDWLRKHGSE